MTGPSLAHPPFGAADLTNCERELIHLAGSIQPNGALLVLHEPDLSIKQVSTNLATMFGVSYEDALHSRVTALGGDLDEQLRRLMRTGLLGQPTPFRCRIGKEPTGRSFVGTAHRHPSTGLIVELELVDETARTEDLPRDLAAAVAEIGSANDERTLCHVAATRVRALTGYDRVMCYKFDPDGHGEVFAESVDPRCEPFLGLHYPASDIPQRARELYIRNRVRVLVDVNYTSVPIEPRISPFTGEELDMSMCRLRSMSPLHLQYLRNMGVTGTLVASIVREGKLWGLIACHHYSPKAVPYDVRAACELLSEVMATRISVVAGHEQVQAELTVRELERRLMDSVRLQGDWRPALFDPPRALLDPLGATGVALSYEGEIRTGGEVPSTADLRLLFEWLGTRMTEPLFACASLSKLTPTFAHLAAIASGVLAIQLSRDDGEYLVWFRGEQRSTVRWAGDPNKPVAIGNDPRELSPRRSFAVWSEQVRETARAWSSTDIKVASHIRVSLLDLALQVRSLRVLIAEHHVARARHGVATAGDPVLIADADGTLLLVNHAFEVALRRPHAPLQSLDRLPEMFTDPEKAREMLFRLRAEGLPWRGELSLRSGAGFAAPVIVRADPVPGPRGELLGFIIIFTDISERKEAEAVRYRVERAIVEALPVVPIGGSAALVAQDFDTLMTTILANASSAVMELTQASVDSSVAPLLRELEAATRRAADLTEQLLVSASRARAAARDASSS